MGTIINAIAIVLGAFIGMTFKKSLPKSLQQSIMLVLGLSLAVLSIGWFMRDFLVIESDGSLSTQYDLLVIIALVLGTLIGEKIDIDGALKRFASGVEKKYSLPPLAQGFISGTLIFCIGAMAILGALQDGLYGDITTLLVKSVLDFITAMMLASVFGIGVMFAAISVLIYQGSITIMAYFAGMFLTDAMIISMSLVGNILLVAMGINFMRITEIKVANMLPALIIPIIYFLILGVF